MAPPPGFTPPIPCTMAARIGTLPTQIPGETDLEPQTHRSPRGQRRLWSQTCVFAQIHTPAQSLLLIASDQGLPSLRDTADGRPPPTWQNYRVACGPSSADPQQTGPRGPVGPRQDLVLERLDDARAPPRPRRSSSDPGSARASPRSRRRPIRRQLTGMSLPTRSSPSSTHAQPWPGDRRPAGPAPGRPSTMEAWAISKGAPEVTVAVFDAGVSQEPPQTSPPSSSPGGNFQHDFLDTDDPYTSHGTHCGGIIAMSGNRRGVAAIGWPCLLMPVVVLDRLRLREREHARRGTRGRRSGGARRLRESGLRPHRRRGR